MSPQNNAKKKKHLLRDGTVEGKKLLKDNRQQDF